MSGLGDQPIAAEFHEKMNSLARMLDFGFNGKVKRKEDKKVGFVLICFNFGDDEGRTNYISNAERKDVVLMLKHQIARFEGQPDVKGHA